MMSLLLKVTLALAIGLVATRIASRARSSVRHAMLASTLASTICMPLATVLSPELPVRVPISGVALGAPISTTAQQTPRPMATPPPSGAPAPAAGFNPSLSTLFEAAWAIGASVLIASLGVGVWRVSRIKRTGVPWLDARRVVAGLAETARIRRHVEVVVHEQAATPFVCGLWHPTIVLPNDALEWSRDDLRRTLVHELEHVHRGDWAVQTAARVICAAYWFHPLIWAAMRRLSLEAERACDDAVVSVSEKTEYAEQLVSLAERLKDTRASPLLAMASRNDLATRVRALLDDTQRRGRPGARAAIAATGAAALIVLALAPVRAVGAPHPPLESDASQSRDRSVSADDARSRDRSVDSGGVRSVDQAPRARRASREDRALYRAAERGDVDRLGALIRGGANVNAPIEGDGTPLIGAAREGHEPAVRLLLDSGADPNLGVNGDGNPLIMAAREGHLAIVELLLARGAAIDQIVDGDENALIQASGEGHLAVVKLLVVRGADVNARAWADSALERPGGEWRTPLKMALRGRHGEVATFLRSAGARE